MKISCQVRGEDIAAGPDRSQLPALMITFYDERRAVIDSEQLGPWTDSFPWRKEEAEVRVPLAAREAIVRIGLHGATGLLEIDGITVTAVPAQ